MPSMCEITNYTFPGRLDREVHEVYNLVVVAVDEGIEDTRKLDLLDRK